ncbi:hypothetical protein GCM10009616_35410 [Microlunatus lacustris]
MDTVTGSLALDRLRRDDPRAAAAHRGALAVNLVLNASWSWVFFRAHRLPAAVVVAGALAPWCTFATVLSTALWRRNR